MIRLIIFLIMCQIAAAVTCNDVNGDGTLIIPTSVTSIKAGTNGFRNCGQLTNVVIPTSVHSIGTTAFYNTGLTSVDIPNSVQTMGDYVFSECPDMQQATIDTPIADYMFYNNKKLSSVTIGNGVTSIGKFAFYNTGLTSVVIPKNVQTVKEYAFVGCISLTKVYVNTSATSIKDGAFDNTVTIHPLPIYGCTDSSAPNHNPAANTDDGSCEECTSDDHCGIDEYCIISTKECSTVSGSGDEPECTSDDHCGIDEYCIISTKECSTVSGSGDEPKDPAEDPAEDTLVPVVTIIIVSSGSVVVIAVSLIIYFYGCKKDDENFYKENFNLKTNYKKMGSSLNSKLRF